MSKKAESYSESTPIADGAITELPLRNGGHGSEDCKLENYRSDDFDQELTQSTDLTTTGREHFKGEDMEADNTLKLSKITRRQKMILFLCTFANFLTACAYSILRPFYPLEAEMKGLDLTMIGFVLGVYQLIVFIVSPIVGNFMSRIGTKFVFISGIFLGGCCSILFGLLDKGPGGTVFLVMCLLVRSVEAVGFAAFMTASMTVASSEFENHAASVLAFLKLASGAGNMIGPVLGGILFDVGGFGLPFYCFAAPVLLNGVFIYKYLPSVNNEKTTEKRSETIFDLLRSPLVIVAMLVLFVNITGHNLFLSTLQKYLEPFGFSSTTVGAIYIVGPACFTALTPVWGYLNDVKNKQAILIICGFLISCIGWFISMPDNVLPFVPFNIWTVMISLLFFGMSVSVLLISATKCLVVGALELNYKKCPDTFAMVSGLCNSMMALGGFVGPVVGGIAVQKYGFSNALMGLGIVNFMMFILVSCFFAFRYFKTIRNKENAKSLS